MIALGGPASGTSCAGLHSRGSPAGRRRLSAALRPAFAGGLAQTAAWREPGQPRAVRTLAAVSPAERGVLLSLSTPVAGQPFVPGLYRMLEQWPVFVAHVATALRPHLDDPETRASCRRLRDAVDTEIPAVFAALPPMPQHPPMPPPAEFPGVLAALDAYRKTSPPRWWSSAGTAVEVQISRFLDIVVDFKIA